MVDVIEVIAFDLGGVFFRDGTIESMPKLKKKLKVSEKNLLEIFRTGPKKEGWQYRRGDITEEEFWQAAKNKLNITSSQIPEIKKIWYEGYKPNRGMINLVKRLKEKSKHMLVIFSENMRDRVDFLNKKYKLEQLFDDAFYSFQDRHNKCEAKFYEHLIERLKCPPENILLIENRPEYCELAECFGIKVIHFKNHRQMKRKLRRFGVKF